MRRGDISYQYMRKDGKVTFICLYNFVVTLDKSGYSIELDPQFVRDSSINSKTLISYLAAPEKKIIRIRSPSENLDKFREKVFAEDISGAEQEVYEYVYKMRKEIAFRNKKENK
jgi:hypothetical protein